MAWVLERLGLSHALYYRWRQRCRLQRLEDSAGEAPGLARALPEEEEELKAYALEHPWGGYRRPG